MANLFWSPQIFSSGEQLLQGLLFNPEDGDMFFRNVG
jgi:hypothetical protein